MTIAIALALSCASVVIGATNRHPAHVCCSGPIFAELNKLGNCTLLLLLLGWPDTVICVFLSIVAASKEYTPRMCDVQVLFLLS